MIDVPTLRKLGTDPVYAPPATFADACVKAADTIDELARHIDGSVRVAADALAAVKRLETELEGERDGRAKLADALSKKDAAMGVLFERLAKAGVDCSDLFS